eukprot:TRINITY_DN16705_c0_g1_i1.p1 TRINITY_DN16705_c0_g1~~TRINITY_DN16705_c0_g1_i1.p1  ORF type:complete len:204 (-),score=47.62 TRINITY_DN16705_c0_g1_i1:87-698(-)
MTSSSPQPIPLTSSTSGSFQQNSSIQQSSMNVHGHASSAAVLLSQTLSLGKDGLSDKSFSAKTTTTSFTSTTTSSTYSFNSTLQISHSSASRPRLLITPSTSTPSPSLSTSFPPPISGTHKDLSTLTFSPYTSNHSHSLSINGSTHVLSNTTSTTNTSTATTTSTTTSTTDNLFPFHTYLSSIPFSSQTQPMLTQTVPNHINK